MPRIRFYVDGLNFYNGVAKFYECKWIDLEQVLLQLSLGVEQQAEVEKVILFSAPTKTLHSRDLRPFLVEPTIPHQRQSNYIAMLAALHPNSFESVVGHAKHKFSCCEKCNHKYEHSLEKGSDVNLAIRMVQDNLTGNDGGKFDIACLVSRDSDFVYVLDALKGSTYQPILITPIPLDKQGKPEWGISKELNDRVPNSHIVKCVEEQVLLNSVLPKVVKGAKKKYTCPNAPGWVPEEEMPMPFDKRKARGLKP